MLRLLTAAVITVALGLLSRLRPISWPWYDRSLGDALYAVAVYLTLSLLFFRAPRTRIAPSALAICLAIEGFQATGIPARFADWGIVRWLIGTTFSWHDVACYVVGVAAITGLDWVLLRPGRK